MNQPGNEQKILTSSFFTCDAEKTKLNWFCFEYALELQMNINRKLRRKLLKFCSSFLR